MTRKFKSGDRVKTKSNTSWIGVDYVGTVIGYAEDDLILVKFDDLNYRQYLYVREENLCLLEGEKNMTIKELKVKFPPEEYRWSAVHHDDLNDDYQDDDSVLEVLFTKNGWLIVYWEKAKPTQKTLSKAKLDKVIELNRKYFLAPVHGFKRNNAFESLQEAEKDCGEEICDTGLLVIVGTIISSTKERNTPNETIYKVYEALGYEIK